MYGEVMAAADVGAYGQQEQYQGVGEQRNASHAVVPKRWSVASDGDARSHCICFV